MLNINQNFDLKAPVFNFDRDYFNSVEELNAYNTSNVPNHFVTNVAGMLYQFTNGKWFPMIGTEYYKDNPSYYVNLGCANAYLEIDTQNDVPINLLLYNPLCNSSLSPTALNINRADHAGGVSIDADYDGTGAGITVSSDSNCDTIITDSIISCGDDSVSVCVYGDEGRVEASSTNGDYTNYGTLGLEGRSGDNSKQFSLSILGEYDEEGGVSLSLKNADRSAKLSTDFGLTVTTDDPFTTNANGETIDIISPDGTQTSCGYFGMILYNQDYSERLRIGDVYVQDDIATGLQLGKDYKSYIYRPLDESKGTIITGVESIAAFSNPSATKVWATDGSTVDLSDYYTKEETDNQIQIAKNSAINIHNEDNSKYITLDINDPKITDEDDSKVNISMFDVDYPCLTTINAKEGFTHMTDEGFTSNLDGNGLYIYNIDTGITKSIDISTNKDLTQEEQDDGYSPVDISLIDGDNSANINARHGFMHKTDDGFTSNLDGEGLITESSVAKSFLNSYGLYLQNKNGNDLICLNVLPKENALIIGSDEKFKISRPADNTEGATITGVKSIAAFSDPSNTKVFATDGSIADLSTKANVADLNAKANVSDVLLKKSASGGYYIEQNNHQLGEKAFAANSSCTASGGYSFAEGYDTNARSFATHVEGQNTYAGGAYSHAEGLCTNASGYCSHAQGVYNIYHIDAIHSVGIGNASINKNAEYIYAKNNENGTGLMDDPKNGYKYLIGVGGYDGISKDNTTYKSVQEVIADLTARIEQLETLVANCVSISNIDEQTN